MPKATLLTKKKVDFLDGSIAELIIWKLPRKTEDRPHGFKYRLYYGDQDGNCLIRYDNETGKGDHKHVGQQELPYTFVDIDTLLADFEHDVDQIRMGLKG